MKKNFKNLISGLMVGVAVISNIVTPMVNAYDANSASTSFIMPDHAVSLKAISEANSYTIVFNANSWTGTMSDLTMTYDQTWSLTTNSFTKTWYTFQWWNTNSWASAATYVDGQDVRNLTTSWNIILYAIWKANPYKVSFNANPGVDTLNPVSGSMSNQDFVYDTPQALTGNKFTRDGYTFLWWSRNASDTSATYTDSQNVNNLTSTSGATVNLYAIWQAKTDTKYTVNHFLMDTNWQYPVTPTYSGEITATTYAVVSPTPRSDEWFTLSGSAQTWHVKWDGSTVFNYYYSRNQYAVTLSAGRWVERVSWAGNYYFNKSVIVSAVLKPWYQNLVWSWDKTTDTFNMPASAVNMTASATPITYSITLDVWSGTISSWSTTINYDVEHAVNIPDPTRTWYDFVWWSGTNLTTPTSRLQIQTWTYWELSYEAVWSARSDVTYYVHHMDKVVWSDTYTQRWEAQEFTGIADATLTLANLAVDVSGDCVTYTGWSLTNSSTWLTNAIATTTISPDGSRHIYLYYTRNIHTVTLTHDTWISTVATQWIYECGATVNISATPKTWYHFKTWEVVSPAWWTPGS